MSRKFLAVIVFLVFSILLLVGWSQKIGPLGTSPKPADPSKQAVVFFESWQHDSERFRMGINLVLATEPKYLEALAFFEENIQLSSNTSDIDYDYYWASFCLAKLGRYEECLENYTALRKGFSGRVIGGASGALRIWDNKLDDLKTLISQETSSRTEEIVEKMRDLDKKSAAWRRELPE